MTPGDILGVMTTHEEPPVLAETSALDCGVCMADFFADPMAQMHALSVAREVDDAEAEAWFLDNYADQHAAHVDGEEGES